MGLAVAQVTNNVALRGLYGCFAEGALLAEQAAWALPDVSVVNRMGYSVGVFGRQVEW
jgi:hypothetical protein